MATSRGGDSGDSHVRETCLNSRITSHVPRVDGRSMSYDDFWKCHMAANRPVVITNLTDTWRSSKDWRLPDGRPNLDFISTNFGASIVQVARCEEKEFSDQKREAMSVADFCQYWQKRQREGDAASGDQEKRTDDQERATESQEETTEGGDGGEGLLYLKDWHFAQEHPGYVAYAPPPLLSPDCLNAYLRHHRLHSEMENETGGAGGGGEGEGGEGDYRFVYMGPTGTWTPLHSDVLRSFSWSANVCGTKRWMLLSPDQTHLIRHRHSADILYDISADVSPDHFPGFFETEWMECVQGEGEALFVPSGWFHQVWNLDDAISINHNWINGCNLHWTWWLLNRDLNEAEAAIEDIRQICEKDEFDLICQRNLAANSGMDFTDFLRFLEVVVEGECRNVISEASSYMTGKTPEGWGKSPQSSREERRRNTTLEIDCGGANLGEHEEGGRVESMDLPFRVSVFNIISVRELLKDMMEGERGSSKDDNCEIRSEGEGGKQRGARHGVNIAFGEEEVNHVDCRSQEEEEGRGVSSEGLGSAYDEKFVARVFALAQHIDRCVEVIRRVLREEWDGLVATFPKIKPVAACMEG